MMVWVSTNGTCPRIMLKSGGLLSNQEYNSILLEIEAARTTDIVTRIEWRAWRDSNPRHPVPKTGALSAELQAH